MGADYLIFTDVSTDIDKEMLKKYDNQIRTDGICVRYGHILL